MTTTVDIATRLAEGDHAAHEQLFRQWYTPLCKYACTIVRDMDEAEDVVQRTFCKLWDQRRDLAIHTSVKSYLYRAVHNDSLNRLRQLKARMEHNRRYLYALPGGHDNVSGHMAYTELQQRAARAIEKLPAQCRRVFELSRVEQLSHAEIARELGISTNTVENHMAKALRLMRQGLSELLPLLLLFILKQGRL